MTEEELKAFLAILDRETLRVFEGSPVMAAPGCLIGYAYGMMVNAGLSHEEIASRVNTLLSIIRQGFEEK